MTLLSRTRRHLFAPKYDRPLTLSPLRYGPYILRPYREDDWPNFIDIATDELTMRNLGWDLSPDANLRPTWQRFNRRLRRTTLRRPDDFIAYAFTNAGGVYLGDASMHLRRTPLGNWSTEHGSIVHPRARGNGRGVDLGHALLAVAFLMVGVDTVRSTIRPDNKASIINAERTGRVHTGYRDNGDLVFTATPETWIAAGGRPDLLRHR